MAGGKLPSKSPGYRESRFQAAQGIVYSPLILFLKILLFISVVHILSITSYQHRNSQYQSVRSGRCRKSAWLNRELLELRWKVYGHWKRGQITWEDYRDVLCRKKICVAKDQLRLKLDSSVQDKKFLEYASANSIGPESKLV